MKRPGRASLKVLQTGEQSVQNRYPVGPDLHVYYNTDTVYSYNYLFLPKESLKCKIFIWKYYSGNVFLNIQEALKGI